MQPAPRFEEAFARVEALMREWKLEEATRVLEELRDRGGHPNRLRHDLSVLYAQQGFFREALAQVEEALAIEPGNRALWHHFLAIQKNNPVQPTAAEWRAMHLAFGDTLRDRHDERHLAVARTEGRKLRVGLLCPDTHLATARFVWPLLESLDSRVFEVYAYWCHAAEVASFERDYPRAAHRPIRGLDDAAIVAMLTADAIDIAVDVAGHGSGNVLTALARRPAPVAVTWLDYLATTGMTEMDFRITDAVADPPGAEAAHVERLLRLPGAQWCYRPPAINAAQRAASRAAGEVVFGSVSVPLKLSDPLLELWAELLERAPGSRLRLLGIPEGRARTRILEPFEARGVHGRVEILPRLTQEEFLHEVAAMDVVLDTYPFSGATSTLDALHQGVPVVTLAGPLSHGRSTASILTALGRPEWIAADREAFLAIASSLAADPSRRTLERSVLREALERSTLCDGAAFADAMGAVLQAAWNDRPVARAPREAAAAFWRGVRDAQVPQRERTPMSAIEIIDCATGDAIAAIAASTREWLLITDAALFDPSTLHASLPSSLLARCDALAAMASDAMPRGDPTCAGEGHVSGAALVLDPQDGRLYASAWVGAAIKGVAAVCGGAFLVRRGALRGAWRLAKARTAPEFRAEVLRASALLAREGARLGASVALAAAERGWPEAAEEARAQAALEKVLGTPRWSQLRPGARASKVVLPREGWARMVPGLEAAVDWPRT